MLSKFLSERIPEGWVEKLFPNGILSVKEPALTALNISAVKSIPRKTNKKSKHYNAVHSFIRRGYGLANQCEDVNCSGKSKQYHWALITGKEYDFKRENFIMLCRSCHYYYDRKNIKRWNLLI